MICLSEGTSLNYYFQDVHTWLQFLWQNIKINNILIITPLYYGSFSWSYEFTCWILERISWGHKLGVRAENGPPMAGTKEPLTGVLPLATWIEESSHARVLLSWTPSSSSSSLRVGAENANHCRSMNSKRKELLKPNVS